MVLVSLCRCPLLVQFLLRVLTGWVQAIDEGATPPTAPPPPNWPLLCQEVAPLLQVNADVLCRHLVCELYSQGLDLRAEEVRDEGGWGVGVMGGVFFFASVSPYGHYIASIGRWPVFK